MKRIAWVVLWRIEEVQLVFSKGRDTYYSVNNKVMVRGFAWII